MREFREEVETAFIRYKLNEYAWNISRTAQALGISKTAVKVRLHRGRQALRSLLDPHLREAK